MSVRRAPYIHTISPAYKRSLFIHMFSTHTFPSFLNNMTKRFTFLFLALNVLISYAAIDSQTYVIHMDKTKIKALTSSLGPSRKWYETILESISSQDQHYPTTNPQLLYVYENVISGFSAKLSKNHLDSIKKVDGFLSATKDQLLTLQTTLSPHFFGLEQGRGLWSPQNLASDVIIGVIDSGIWPEHSSFSGAGVPPIPSRWKGKCQTGTNFSSSNCNRKLIGAGAFFKGYEANQGKINETLEYKSPRDSHGHGTHTASTAAGNLAKDANFLGLAKGTASGMRYTTRIAAYKTCYQYGCTSTDILAAIEQAVTDGVDVLSLSIAGHSEPYYSDNIAIAAFRAIQKGVFVACSAGNEGPAFSTVSNFAPWIMTVAASYMDRSFPTKIQLGNGQILTGASLYNERPSTENLPLVYDETAGSKGSARFCTEGSLSPTLIKGKVVICDEDIIPRVDKGEQVKLGGGAGMILANNEEDGEEIFADSHLLPATSLGATGATAVRNYTKSSKNATVLIKFEGTVYGNPAPVMAAFSSRGPSNIDPNIMKPDITAPGVNILAAWPPNLSPTRLKSDKRSVEYNIISGTSMSCPHVSGIATLIKSLHEDWSPSAIKSALMTTAYIHNNQNTSITDLGSIETGSNFATPFAFGSGHVDPEKASNPGLIYDIDTEDYLRYLCSLKYNSRQMALFSDGNFTCPGKSKFQPGDLNYPSFAVTLSSGNGRSFTRTRTATNVGDSESTYVVKVTEPKGVSVVVKPASLKFVRVGEKLSYKVRFKGVGEKIEPDSYSFGYIEWVSIKYSVKSPIGVTFSIISIMCKILFMLDWYPHYRSPEL